MEKFGSLPLITVVTPVRNAAETLEETVQSILSQDYPNLEYIVIDGGSTDGSLEIIYEHSREIDVFLYGRDRNLYDALAKAFDVARGSVLAWLNADDIYEPGILRRVGRTFSEHPDWDVVYFDGTVWKQGWRTPNRNQRSVGLEELMQGHILYQDSVFFTRRAYEAVGGLDRLRYKLAGDYDLWLRLAARFEFHYIPETASCFRIRDGQLSGDWTSYTREMALAQSAARERHRTSPPIVPGRGLLARQIRQRRSERIDAGRKFNFPLRDENLSWPNVAAQPLGSLTHCRCSICGEQPNRLLFSTPDTWFGDRRLWHIYYCDSCAASFVFPPPSDATYHELHARSLQPLPCEAPNGAYRLQATPRLLEGNDLYLKAADYFDRFASSVDDRVELHEHRHERIVEIGCGSGRMLDALRERGFSNVSGLEIHADRCDGLRSRGHDVTNGEFFATPPPEGGVGAVVLHLTLECFHDPVAALRQVRSWLRPGGRVYVSTSNLDSVWASRYGPMWSRWHAPFHRSLFGARALRKLASWTGFRMKWMTSCSPPEWLYHSDLLAGRGLGGYVSPDLQPAGDPDRWRHALGAAVLSRFRWDWRLRGDCLQACLVKKGR